MLLTVRGSSFLSENYIIFLTLSTAPSRSSATPSPFGPLSPLPISVGNSNCFSYNRKRHSLGSRRSRCRGMDSRGLAEYQLGQRLKRRRGMGLRPGCLRLRALVRVQANCLMPGAVFSERSTVRKTGRHSPVTPLNMRLEGYYGVSGFPSLRRPPPRGEISCARFRPARAGSSEGSRERARLKFRAASSVLPVFSRAMPMFW